MFLKIFYIYIIGSILKKSQTSTKKGRKLLTVISI